MVKWAAGFLIVLIVAVLAWQVTRPLQSPDVDVRIIAPDQAIPNLGFQAVQDGYDFQFPADQQPHSDYQYERWQLVLSNCYQTAATVTFDRIGLIAEALASERESDWAFRQVMIAEVQLPEFSESRYSRSALDLAGAEPGHVWLEDWSLAWDENSYTLKLGDLLDMQLTASTAPQTEHHEGYYVIQQNLAGAINDNACEVVLLQSFGEGLP